MLLCIPESERFRTCFDKFARFQRHSRRLPKLVAESLLFFATGFAVHSMLNELVEVSFATAFFSTRDFTANFLEESESVFSCQHVITKEK